MKCPVCIVDLLMADRQGVEIDYCTKCRGIWLDRGELEKLIELASATSYRSTRETSQGYQPHSSDYDDEEPRRSDPRKPHKKESWLSRLMDFD